MVTMYDQIWSQHVLISTTLARCSWAKNIFFILETPSKLFTLILHQLWLGLTGWVWHNLPLLHRWARRCRQSMLKFTLGAKVYINIAGGLLHATYNIPILSFAHLTDWQKLSAGVRCSTNPGIWFTLERQKKKNVWQLHTGFIIETASEMA